MAYWRNKLVLRTQLRNLNLKSQFSIFHIFRDIRVHIYDFVKFVGGLWALNGRGKLFFGQSIGIGDNNTFLALRKKLTNLHAKSQ